MVFFTISLYIIKLTIYNIKCNKEGGKKMVTELRVLRVRRGMNQDELAEKLNVTRNSISAWENGTKPSLENAKKIADFFGVPINEIFFTTNNN